MSIDGSKHPSKYGWSADKKDERAVEPRLIRLAAFTDGKKPDLLTGWVQPCSQLASNVDALVILRQYGRLLQYLGANEMNHANMKEFHDWLLLKNENYERLLTLNQMREGLPAYLCTMIRDRYPAPAACAPFERVYPHNDEVAVFDDFFYGKGHLAIDIWCSMTQFTIVLYDRKSVTESAHGAEVMTQALTESGLIGFSLEEGKHSGYEQPRYVKVFNFPSQELAMFDFMDQVLQRFSKLKTNI